jgi:hypothetical protein
MTTPSGMRISHADREAAAAGLRDHFAAGRLTLDEFQQRLDAVFAAKTDRELAGINRDLPRLTNSPAPWPHARQAVPAGRAPSGGYGAGSRQGRRSRPWPALNLAMLVLALVFIVALARPFGWLSDFLPRPLIILAIVIAFVFRMLRRIGGRAGRTGRGGRWRPF